ncbi:MAG: hypothetical protein IPK88_15465 [Saprospiraceae bacterium]|nr:hypothetical protein [Candidatus Defluviibacterium haderslevense]
MFKLNFLFIISLVLIIAFGLQIIPGHSQCFNCKNAPKGTIWCDDFEDATPLNQKYFEYNDNQEILLKWIRWVEIILGVCV